MNGDELLGEAAAIGDAMAELLQRVAPQDSKPVRERWDGLMGEVVRADIAEPAEPTDYMEEFGDHPEVAQ